MDSVDRFLAQTAAKGSWYGGGSAAALTCALSAALLEKLARGARLARELRTIRRRCAALVDQDARTFARVIRAMARHDQRAMRQALKAAIAIPARVDADAKKLLSFAQAIRLTISPRYRVDLDCALALAQAAGQSARALARTNRAWLKQA